MGGSRAHDVHDRRIMLSSKRTNNREFSARTVSVAGGIIAAAALASGAAVGAATMASATGRATTSTAAAPVKLSATVHQDVRSSGAHRRANARPSTYTVKPGDSLYRITGRLFGNPALWPRFYAANIKVVGANPGQITAGQRLTVRLASHGETGQVIAVQQAPAVTDPGIAVSAPVTAAAASGGSAPGGSFGACVRAAESGGNYQAVNPGGYYGAYQFSASTWAEYGGNPADYGHASPAEQDQVFANAIAQGGQSNWAPYDGC
jgi:LysM repeat protein